MGKKKLNLSPDLNLKIPILGGHWTFYPEEGRGVKLVKIWSFVTFVIYGTSPNNLIAKSQFYPLTVRLLKFKKSLNLQPLEPFSCRFLAFFSLNACLRTLRSKVTQFKQISMPSIGQLSDSGHFWNKIVKFRTFLGKNLKFRTSSMLSFPALICIDTIYIGMSKN